jgi:hypothetical protein
MVIVASIYLRFYIEVRVSIFLPTPTPTKIRSDFDSTALPVVAEVGTKPSVDEQLKSYIQRLHLKLNVVKFKDQNNIEISSRFAVLKNL